MRKTKILQGLVPENPPAGGRRHGGGGRHGDHHCHPWHSGNHPWWFHYGNEVPWGSLLLVQQTTWLLGKLTPGLTSPAPAPAPAPAPVPGVVLSPFLSPCSFPFLSCCQ